MKNNLILYYIKMLNNIKSYYIIDRIFEHNKSN